MNHSIMHADGAAPTLDPVRLYAEQLETDALPKLYGDDAIPAFNDAFDLLRLACADETCRRRVNAAYDAAMALAAESCDDGIRFGAALLGVFLER